MVWSGVCVVIMMPEVMILFINTLVCSGDSALCSSHILCHVICRLYHHKTSEPSTGFFATITNMVRSCCHNDVLYCWLRLCVITEIK